MSSITDNEICLNLIEQYAANQLLWNSRHEDYYDKTKRDNVWSQIAENLGAPKEELIAKMRSLAGSYRREKNREKKGIAQNRPYQSKWYAYQAFSFLRDKDHDPLATEDADLPELRDNKNFVEIKEFDEATDENGDDSDTPLQTTAQSVQEPVKNKKKLKRKLPEASDSKVQSGKNTNNSAPKPDKLARNINTDDPYITYGLYIATELRKYDSYTLAHVKHAINNVIFKADTEFLERNSSKNCNCSTDKRDTLTEQIKIEIDNDGTEFD